MASFKAGTTRLSSTEPAGIPGGHRCSTDSGAFISRMRDFFPHREHCIPDRLKRIPAAFPAERLDLVAIETNDGHVAFPAAVAARELVFYLARPQTTDR